MSEFPSVRALNFGNGSVYSSATSLLGLSQGTPASTAWPSANLAIFVPVRITNTVTAYKLVTGAGVTAAGNFDVGIYDGAGHLLIASGATAKGNSTEHIIDIADTQLGPGLYYMAMSADGTNNYSGHTPSGATTIPLQKARLYGTLEMAAAYPLPATATFASRTTTFVPWIAMYLRGY